VREVKLGSDDITVDAEGYHEVVDRVPVLTRIHARYALRIPAGSRETVDRALDRHVSKCPTAQSLVGAVEVTWEADISETGA
jgi:uncharacterized OsmC-like protein